MKQVRGDGDPGRPAVTQREGSGDGSAIGRLKVFAGVGEQCMKRAVLGGPQIGPANPTPPVRLADFHTPVWMNLPQFTVNGYDGRILLMTFVCHAYPPT